MIKQASNWNFQQIVIPSKKKKEKQINPFPSCQNTIMAQIQSEY